MDERNPCATGNVILCPEDSIASGPLRLPAIIAQAGHGARFAYEEFFHAKIRNAHTRRAYRRAVLSFLQWCDIRERRLQVGDGAEDAMLEAPAAELGEEALDGIQP